MKKIFFIFLSLFLFSGCVQNENQDLTGRYFITHYRDVENNQTFNLNRTLSYIELVVDKEGNKIGTIRITSLDGKYANTSRINQWSYNKEINKITFIFQDGDPIDYDVVEYGKVIKLDGNGILLIAEK
jgi:outer membrane lipoprotein-sorting protein